MIRIHVCKCIIHFLVVWFAAEMVPRTTTHASFLILSAYCVQWNLHHFSSHFEPVAYSMIYKRVYMYDTHRYGNSCSCVPFSFQLSTATKTIDEWNRTRCTWNVCLTSWISSIRREWERRNITDTFDFIYVFLFSSSVRRLRAVTPLDREDGIKES